MRKAVELFQYQFEKNFIPARKAIIEMGFNSVVGNFEMAVAYYRQAQERLAMERYPHVPEALELALTNYHEVVDGIQPPKENREQ